MTGLQPLVSFGNATWVCAPGWYMTGLRPLVLEFDAYGAWFFNPTMQRDTRQLLRTGLAIFGGGAVAAALAEWVFGGIGRQGPHTNSGWLALMIAMGCLPTGTLTLVLAIAKWIGDRKR
jgi:hypothetical protein